MYWGLYQLIVVLSAGASAGLWLVRPTRPVLAFAATAGWTVVALQARNISFYSGGSSFSTGSEAWQLVCLGMALLSLTTAILWYVGVYPPVKGDDAGSAEVPGERATMSDEVSQ